MTQGAYIEIMALFHRVLVPENDTEDAAEQIHVGIQRIDLGHPRTGRSRHVPVCFRFCPVLVCDPAASCLSPKLDLPGGFLQDSVMNLSLPPLTLPIVLLCI